MKRTEALLYWNEAKAFHLAVRADEWHGAETAFDELGPMSNAASPKTAERIESILATAASGAFGPYFEWLAKQEIAWLAESRDE